MIRRVSQWANLTSVTRMTRWRDSDASSTPSPAQGLNADQASPGAREDQRVQERTRELQAATDKAQAALADAEQAERLKDTFLAMASHELRTPLQATLYWAEMLRTDPSPALAAEAARHIIHNVHVQSRLIDDLLDLSRFLTGEFHLESCWTDPVEVVEKAAEVVRAEAQRRGINLELQRPASPVTMLTDPVRLEQVAWNLMSNAVHASANGAAIQVRMQATADVFRLEVQDGGVGIDPREIPHLFEPFRRGPHTSSHIGMGLGLPITRSIVQQFGGTIEAFSDGPKRGALFTVVLPLRGKTDQP